MMLCWIGFALEQVHRTPTCIATFLLFQTKCCLLSHGRARFEPVAEAFCDRTRIGHDDEFAPGSQRRTGGRLVGLEFGIRNQTPDVRYPRPTLDKPMPWGRDAFVASLGPQLRRTIAGAWRLRLAAKIGT